MRRVAFIALLALLLSTPTSVGHADDARGGEVGVLVGMVAADGALVGTGDPELEPTFGVRGGSVFHSRFGWFVDFLVEDVESKLGFGEARTWVGRTGFEWYLHPRDDVRWFLAAGPGWLAVEFDDAPGQDFHRPLASLGVGQRIRIGGNTRLRWELRGDHTLDDPGIGGEDLSAGRFLVGISWGPGSGGSQPRISRSPNDADDDGVVDRRDRCLGTALGALVDNVGCAVDTDADGVADGIDRCIETPAGGIVGTDGCPLDSDADGVRDTADVCPSTPEDAAVDEWGCARDRDRDGVPDGIDRCTDTTLGAIVDDSGCALDADRDGVPDGFDRCPDSPSGQLVEPDGCVRAPAPAPLAPPVFEDDETPVVLEGVAFETASSTLTWRAIDRLTLIAEGLRARPDLRVEIGGHTDSIGDAGVNLSLSRRRAEAVRDFLVEHGIPADRLATRGYGEEAPIADNASAVGRARNRRVELTRID